MSQYVQAYEHELKIGDFLITFWLKLTSVFFDVSRWFVK